MKGKSGMSELRFKKESIAQLQDLFEFLHDNMEKLLADLADGARCDEAVNTLFRQFHTIKALVRYLGIEPMIRTVTAMEDVLSILRYKKGPVSKELLDWMYLMSDHILEWNDAVEKGHFDVDPVDAYTLNLIRTISIADENPAELLKEMHIAVLSDAEACRDKMGSLITERVGKVTLLKKAGELPKLLDKEGVELILCDSVLGEVDIVKLILKIQKTHPHIPCIIHRLAILTPKKLEYLEKLGVTDFIPKDFTPEELLAKLQKVARSNAKNRGIRLRTCPLLKERVEALQPLPGTIKELQAFGADPESSLRDIGAVVMQDAVLSAKILKLVNSATFGLSGKVSSIQQAISLLGKERTIALSLQTFAQDSFEFDLAPYCMSSDDFFSVANRRLNLAVAWYSKVSLSETTLLSTAALIANIGQLLVVEEIRERGMEQPFSDLVMQYSPRVAEIEFLNTTTEDMTADILNQWGVEDEMADLVRYSNDLLNAPDSVKHLAVAMYVINTTVPMNNLPVSAEKIQEMCDLLLEMNFDAKPYQKAVEKVLAG